MKCFFITVRGKGGEEWVGNLWLTARGVAAAALAVVDDSKVAAR
jgi:hypothetical protein